MTVHTKVPDAVGGVNKRVNILTGKFRVNIPKFPFGEVDLENFTDNTQ